MNGFLFHFQTEVVLRSHGAEVDDLEFLVDLDEVVVDKSSEQRPVNPTRDEWITLNVGGIRFLTCRSTLSMNAGQTGMLVSWPLDSKFCSFSFEPKELGCIKKVSYE